MPRISALLALALIASGAAAGCLGDDTGTIAFSLSVLPMDDEAPFRLLLPLPMQGSDKIFPLPDDRHNSDPVVVLEGANPPRAYEVTGTSLAQGQMTRNVEDIPSFSPTAPDSNEWPKLEGNTSVAYSIVVELEAGCRQTPWGLAGVAAPPGAPNGTAWSKTVGGGAVC